MQVIQLPLRKQESLPRGPSDLKEAENYTSRSKLSEQLCLRASQGARCAACWGEGTSHPALLVAQCMPPGTDLVEDVEVPLIGGLTSHTRFLQEVGLDRSSRHLLGSGTQRQSPLLSLYSIAIY